MVQGQLHKKMRTNEIVNTISNKRYLVIMHGNNMATFVDTPFTSSKMDIYHQLRNLRMKAEKVNQVVLHQFYDIPEYCFQSLKDTYEGALWGIDDRNGKYWDDIYKELLLELDGYKVKKQPKQKKTEVVEHTPERDADGDLIVKLPKPVKMAAKPVKKDTKKNNK